MEPTDDSDAVRILGVLFSGLQAQGCSDAGDANDDGGLDISDPVTILLYLFGGGVPLPAPGPGACGPDPTADTLPTCELAC